MVDKGEVPLVAAIDSRPSPTPSDGVKRSSLSLYARGQGGGLVRTGRLWIPGLWPVRIVSGDLNGDGYGDLVVAMAGSNEVMVFIQNPQVGFGGQLALMEPTYRIPVGQAPSDLALADVDGAHGLDIVVTNYATGDVSILRNDP